MSKAVNRASENEGPTWGDRAWGCLFGGAVGDAFGYPIEFWSRARIEAAFGPGGLRESVPDAPRGTFLVSDDTQMTMFTVEGLVLAEAANNDAPDPDCLQARRLASIRLAYLDWLETQGGGGGGKRLGLGPGSAMAGEEGGVTNRPPGRLVHLPVMRHSRAPGSTCLTALRAGGLGTPESPPNRSKGCGGVMRVAPIGLLTDLSVEQAFDLAARAAALTHGHPSGYLSAGMMAGIVRLLVTGQTLREAVMQALAVLQRWDSHEETSRAVTMALAVATEESAFVPKRLGEGWVGEEALAIALWALLVAAEFPEVLRLAANHDGDSDSTASIAGQLWGAQHGREGIPEDWVRGLDVQDELEELWRALRSCVHAE